MAQACLPSILLCLERHPGEPEVASKALVMLGVLGQASRSLLARIQSVQAVRGGWG